MTTITQPDWIIDPISREDAEAIMYGGCESGAYMPAVTYWQAAKTMHEHGDDVIDYIQDAYGELPPPPEVTSWSGMACHYLSMAVKLWVSCQDLDDFDYESEDNIEGVRA